ncbi:hypothetical protein BKA63DRAFT_548036 [Paraphoma chrysanthemicola]|nr:hypothetical protein BKA63DRAFT_548036 [Paraphoma chrysanthemicola]
MSLRVSYMYAEDAKTYSNNNMPCSGSKAALLCCLGHCCRRPKSSWQQRTGLSAIAHKRVPSIAKSSCSLATDGSNPPSQTFFRPRDRKMNSNNSSSTSGVPPPPPGTGPPGPPPPPPQPLAPPAGLTTMTLPPAPGLSPAAAAAQFDRQLELDNWLSRMEPWRAPTWRQRVAPVRESIAALRRPHLPPGFDVGGPPHLTTWDSRWRIAVWHCLNDR